MPVPSNRCEAWSPVIEDDPDAAFSRRCSLKPEHAGKHVAIFYDEDGKPARIRWPKAVD